MGGSKPSQPSFVQPPPPQIIQQPAQPLSPGDVRANAEAGYQAQLQYNEPLARQAYDIYQQYNPQYQRQEYQLQAELQPQYKQLQDSLYPTQAANLQQLATQAGQRFASPQGLTPDQQSAQDAFRTRQRDELSRTMREQANLGGNLYGGRSQAREMRAQAELSNQYANQDIALMDQRRAQALQEMIAASQVNNPQISQVNTPGFTQGVAPSADALLQAMMAQSGNYLVNPSVYKQGTPGTPSWLGSFSRGFGGQPMY